MRPAKRRIMQARRRVSIHASVKDATSKISSKQTIPFCFNPRICKRCDLAVPVLTAATTVSIHASVKDATNFDDLRQYVEKVSIHASVKDATMKEHGIHAKV